MMEKNKYCKEILKNEFKIELAMSQKDENYFRKAGKCWICGKKYIDGGVIVRDHCCVTRKFRGSAHKDLDINLRLTHKIPVIFMQDIIYARCHVLKEISRFGFEINVIPNSSCWENT